jgi:hypothetical protein
VSLFGVVAACHMTLARDSEWLSMDISVVVCEFYLMPWGVTCLAYRA